MDGNMEVQMMKQALYDYFMNPVSGKDKSVMLSNALNMNDQKAYSANKGYVNRRTPEHLPGQLSDRFAKQGNMYNLESRSNTYGAEDVMRRSKKEKGMMLNHDTSFTPGNEVERSMMNSPRHSGYTQNSYYYPMFEDNPEIRDIGPSDSYYDPSRYIDFLMKMGIGPYPNNLTR